MVKVSVVRVFTNKDGKYGSPAGIVFDEDNQLSSKERQAITIKLGFSETVFVNRRSPAEISMYSLTGEIPFAGAPLLGAAWLVGQQQASPVESIMCGGKQVKVTEKDALTWISVNSLEGTPPWNHQQLKNYEEVEKLSADDKPFSEHTYVWAWIDEKSETGRVRARTFAPDWGIPEEEANGSGSMQLAHKLGRNLEIIHGKGSLIKASVGENGIAIGGWVKVDPVITI